MSQKLLRDVLDSYSATQNTDINEITNNNNLDYKALFLFFFFYVSKQNLKDLDSTVELIIQIMLRWIHPEQINTKIKNNSY